MFTVENFNIVAPMLAGAWLVIMALLTSTKNVALTIVYNIIPFFLGCACLLAGLKLWGVV